MMHDSFDGPASVGEWSSKQDDEVTNLRSVDQRAGKLGDGRCKTTSSWWLAVNGWSGIVSYDDWMGDERRFSLVILG